MNKEGTNETFKKMLHGILLLQVTGFTQFALSFVFGRGVRTCYTNTGSGLWYARDFGDWISSCDAVEGLPSLSYGVYELGAAVYQLLI